MEKRGTIAKVALWVLMAISLILIGVLFFSIESQENPGARAENMISLNINWAVILTVAGFVLALGFALIQILKDKKQIISTLLLLVGVAVLVFVSWALSTSELPQFFGVDKFVADGTLTPSISRWIGAGLICVYILFGAAALSVVFFSLKSSIKRN